MLDHDHSHHYCRCFGHLVDSLALNRFSLCIFLIISNLDFYISFFVLLDFLEDKSWSFEVVMGLFTLI